MLVISWSLCANTSTVCRFRILGQHPRILCRCAVFFTPPTSSTHKSHTQLAARLSDDGLVTVGYNSPGAEQEP